MKKSIVFLSSIALIGISLVGCQKKGEGDPSISFHGRKARISGEWTASAGTSTDISGSTSTLTTITETSATVTSGTKTDVYTYSDKLTIETDGTWKQVVTRSSASGFSITSTTSGTWNWTGGVGDAKKRAQIAMATLSSTDVTTIGSGTPTTVTKTYVGSEAPTSVYNIYQLKNKEMIIKWDGSYTSSSGSSSSSKGEMTYKQ